MRARIAQPRGFVMLAALAVLAVVGVAILALATAMSYDGRRTMERAQRAQLDQLLLSAATDAAEHFKTSSPTVGDWWNVDLPDVLAEQNAELVTTVVSADESNTSVAISARISKHSAQQVLRFRRGTDGWKLVGAEIPI
jgi:Tfp pilus assembly protein PilE